MNKTLGLSIIISAAVSALVSAFVFQMMMPEIKTVAIERLIESHVSKVSDKYEMGEKELNEYSEAFGSQLEDALDYFSEDGEVILVQPAVVRGGKDITDKVYDHILEKINQ